MSPLPTTITKPVKRPRTEPSTAERAPKPTFPSTPAPHTIIDPIAEQDISNELLDTFHELGLTRQQIRDVSRQWLITKTELTMWEQKHDAATAEGKRQADREIHKLANQMAACINQRGQVTTPAILNATGQQLLDYIDYYEQELDHLYDQLEAMHDTMHPDRLAALDQQLRLTTYLWECKTTAGLTPITYQVLTAKNLEARLDATLTEHERTRP